MYCICTSDNTYLKHFNYHFHFYAFTCFMYKCVYFYFYAFIFTSGQSTNSSVPVLLASSASSCCWSDFIIQLFSKDFWHLCIFCCIEMYMNFLLQWMAGNWISTFIFFILLLGLQCCRQTTCFVFNILLFFIKCIFLQGSHVLFYLLLWSFC